MVEDWSWVEAEAQLSGHGTEIYQSIGGGGGGGGSVEAEYSNEKEESLLLLQIFDFLDLIWEFNAFEGKFTWMVYKLYAADKFGEKIDSGEWNNFGGDIEDGVPVVEVVAVESYERDSSLVSEVVAVRSHEKDSSLVWGFDLFTRTEDFTELE